MLTVAHYMKVKNLKDIIIALVFLEAALQFICGWYLHKQYGIDLQKGMWNELKRC